MHFESPWAFLLLLILPFLVWFNQFKIKGGSIRFSFVGNAAKAGKSFRQKLLWLPTVMRMAAMVLLIIALARPQTGRELIREIS